jgi:hypothetical protein
MRRQRLSPGQHAVLDFLLAGALLLLPTWLGFTGAALWLSAGAGLLNGVSSMLTAYRGGVVRVLPFRVHLVLDGLIGVAFLGAALLGGFPTLATGYFLVAGLGIGLAVLVTRPS